MVPHLIRVPRLVTGYSIKRLIVKNKLSFSKICNHKQLVSQCISIITNSVSKCTLPTNSSILSFRHKSQSTNEQDPYMRDPNDLTNCNSFWTSPDVQWCSSTDSSFGRPRTSSNLTKLIKFWTSTDVLWPSSGCPWTPVFNLTGRPYNKENSIKMDTRKVDGVD